MSWTVKGVLVKPSMPPSSRRPPRPFVRVTTSMAMSDVSASSCSLRTLPSSSTSFSSSLSTGALLSMETRISAACCIAILVSEHSCFLNESWEVRSPLPSWSTARQRFSNCSTRLEWSASCSRSAFSSSRRAFMSRLPVIEKLRGITGHRHGPAGPIVLQTAPAMDSSACSRDSRSDCEALSSFASALHTLFRSISFFNSSAWATS
mmetsp:Transcript_41336/g.128487  ORF Transcript_41336/g.128487 Transcript_41336/m.128487 type:complete len:206 (-) Transcript_41336:405-1022(-)